MWAYCFFTSGLLAEKLSVTKTLPRFYEKKKSEWTLVEARISRSHYLTLMVKSTQKSSYCRSLYSSVEPSGFFLAWEAVNTFWSLNPITSLVFLESLAVNPSIGVNRFRDIWLFLYRMVLSFWIWNGSQLASGNPQESSHSHTYQGESSDFARFTVDHY